jgi:hypothetical protein
MKCSTYGTYSKQDIEFLSILLDCLRDLSFERSNALS